MPEKQTLKKAKRARREGKSPSTQAGAFVREEIEHIREGKHGARSTKQAIAIGLSKARRAGVALKPPTKASSSKKTQEKAKTDLQKSKSNKPISKARSQSSLNALKKEPHRAASHASLSRQAKETAVKRRTGQSSSARTLEKAKPALQRGQTKPLSKAHSQSGLKSLKKEPHKAGLTLSASKQVKKTADKHHTTKRPSVAKAKESPTQKRQTTQSKTRSLGSALKKELHKSTSKTSSLRKAKETAPKRPGVKRPSTLKKIETATQKGQTNKPISKTRSQASSKPLKKEPQKAMSRTSFLGKAKTALKTSHSKRPSIAKKR